MPSYGAHSCRIPDSQRAFRGENVVTDHAIDRRVLMQPAAFSPALAAVGASHASAADSADALVVIAELVAKPGRADALCDILVPFTAGARHEPGCERYVLLEDRETPGRFLTYEVWTNSAALAAHMVTPEIKAAGPKLADILAQPFTQAKLKVLSGV